MGRSGIRKTTSSKTNDLSSIRKSAQLSTAKMMKQFAKLLYKLDVPLNNPIVSVLAVTEHHQRFTENSLGELSTDKIETTQGILKSTLDQLKVNQTKQSIPIVTNLENQYEGSLSTTHKLKSDYTNIIDEYEKLTISQKEALPELVKQYIENEISIKEVSKEVRQMLHDLRKYNPILKSGLTYAYKQAQTQFEQKQIRLFDEMYLELGKQNVPLSLREQILQRRPK